MFLPYSLLVIFLISILPLDSFNTKVDFENYKTTHSTGKGFHRKINTSICLTVEGLDCQLSLIQTIPKEFFLDVFEVKNYIGSDWELLTKDYIETERPAHLSKEYQVEFKWKKKITSFFCTQLEFPIHLRYQKAGYQLYKKVFFPVSIVFTPNCFSIELLKKEHNEISFLVPLGQASMKRFVEFWTITISISCFVLICANMISNKKQL